MKTERVEAVWVEEAYSLTVGDLGERWGMSPDQIQEFIEHGVVEPIGTRSCQGSGQGSGLSGPGYGPGYGPGSDPGSFNLDAVSVLQTACRLQQELELDTHAVGVVLELVQRLRALENELCKLKARLPAEASAEDEPPAADVIA